MDKETLRKVQLAQLDIATEIKRVCEENGIRYFLEAGTLLGAIRHKGFIPWDDDMDFGMLRDEYNKFIKIAPKKMNKQYHLETWWTDKFFPYPYAKVYKKGTVYVEKSSENSLKTNELFIDVFPRDHLPNNLKDREKIAKEMQYYRHLLMIKCGFKPWKREKNKKRILVYLKYFPFMLISVFTNTDLIKQKWERALVRYNNEKTAFLGLASSVSYNKYTVPFDSIGEYAIGKFENIEFSIPCDAHSFLESLYGDYMQLPSIEERENRHQVIKISL